MWSRCAFKHELLECFNLCFHRLQRYIRKELEAYVNFLAYKHNPPRIYGLLKTTFCMYCIMHPWMNDLGQTNWNNNIYLKINFKPMTFPYLKQYKSLKTVYVSKLLTQYYNSWKLIYHLCFPSKCKLNMDNVKFIFIWRTQLYKICLKIGWIV